MRRIASVAAIGLLTLAAAYDIGAYVRRDYFGEEPGRDIAVGLGALVTVAALGWATSAPVQRKVADSEH